MKITVVLTTEKTARVSYGSLLVSKDKMTSYLDVLTNHLRIIINFVSTQL